MKIANILVNRSMLRRACVILVLNCCLVAQSSAADSPGYGALVQLNKSNLVSALTDTSNAQIDRLTFFHVGEPLSLYRPESRLVVGKGPNATIEYIELLKSIELIAVDMAEDGITDVSRALSQSAKHRLTIPLSQCPGVSEKIDDLEDSAIAEISSDRHKDAEGIKTITFDYGDSYHFHFGHMGAKSFGYITVTNGPTSKKMAELKKYILSCLI